MLLDKRPLGKGWLRRSDVFNKRPNQRVRQMPKCCQKNRMTVFFNDKRMNHSRVKPITTYLSLSLERWLCHEKVFPGRAAPPSPLKQTHERVHP